MSDGFNKEAVPQKTSVLLAEYNTLRSEVMAARANVAQAVALSSGVTMAATGFSFGKDGPGWILFVVLLLLASLYLYATFGWNENNTRKFTKRIREIEAEINAGLGEYLLHWETDYGWGSIFPKNLNPHWKGYTFSPNEPPRMPAHRTE